MWLIIKEALLALVQANPETIIHLANKLNAITARTVVLAR